MNNAAELWSSATAYTHGSRSTKSPHIRNADALEIRLGRCAATGRVLTYVFGNPPFGGSEVPVLRTSGRKCAESPSSAARPAGHSTTLTAWFIKRRGLRAAGAAG